LENPILQAVRFALLPVWVLQIFSGEKSFRANGLIGSSLLNRLGLHVVRKVLAHAVTGARRAALSPLAPAALRREFRAKGYIKIENFLPADVFMALCAEADALLSETDQQIQEGDTVTRLALIDDEAAARSPALRRFANDRRMLDLSNYVGARLKLPFCYVQSIRRDFTANVSDPQKDAHSDTFFPTLKGWLFLDDVDADLAPFHYSPRSHRLTRARLAWEYKTSLNARSSANPHVAAGSFRPGPDDLRAMGLAEPTAIAARANTLVLADTVGFHRRGEAKDGRARRAVYIWMRANPFNPIPGFRLQVWRKMELAITKARRAKAGRRLHDTLVTS
jgi:hypothetical protein